MTPRHFRTVIVGGGPAGLAPLVSASRDGRLAALLDGGVAVIERGPSVGAGRLGDYAINSDSTADTFLTAVLGHADPRLGTLAAEPLCRCLAAMGRAAVPLETAGLLMGAVGSVLGRAVLDAGGAVWTGTEVLGAWQTGRGAWRVRLRPPSGNDAAEITADHLVLATGGEQTAERLHRERVAGQPLLPLYRDTLVLSDDLLKPSGLAAARARLSGARPRVAIVGGSTSALAAAGALLRHCRDLLVEPGSITVHHRRPLRVFYPSIEAARDDGYHDFGPDDVCPLSGFVYRLAGFRLDSRDLLKRVLGIGGSEREPRVILHDLGAHEPAETHRRLAAADVVVAALGYRPRALPINDANGHSIVLRGQAGREPMVDDACRVHDVAGRPLANLFGIGLAAGFVPRGRLGGEPSFRGQANGLWLWQTAVGALIVDHILAGRAPPIAMPMEDVAPAAVRLSPVAA